ncbi:MAG: hypothetical protein QXQ41_01080 [Candidatus Bathyarchaeia archaeon]
MGSAGEQAGIMLTKDAVYWNDQTSITIYVRNTGTSDAYINAVYIGTSQSNLTRIDNPQFGDGAVPADGGVAEIVIDNYAWTPGTKYYFRIVPKTGAPLEFSERAPSTGP